MKRARLAAILLTALPVLGTACGSSSRPPMQMMTAVWWNSDPTTADEIGYEVLVDFGWMDRSKECFPLSPDLELDVNDHHVSPTAPGLCQWDILVRLKGFLQDEPLAIRITDGDDVLGAAVFTGMFPGAGTQLVSPVGGTVRAGDKIVLAIPSGLMARTDSLGANFYWRDAPDGVPPFHTFTPGAAGADSGTVEITAPMQTGRADLAISTIISADYVTAETCEGFQYCLGQPNSDTLGPVSVEVVP